MNNPEFAALQHLGGSSNFSFLSALVLVPFNFFTRRWRHVQQKNGVSDKSGMPHFLQQHSTSAAATVFSSSWFWFRFTLSHGGGGMVTLGEVVRVKFYQENEVSHKSGIPQCFSSTVVPRRQLLLMLFSFWFLVLVSFISQTLLGKFRLSRTRRWRDGHRQRNRAFRV